eukprot:jgi/Botrbrau1/14488/Bobra.0014s0122.1
MKSLSCPSFNAALNVVLSVVLTRSAVALSSVGQDVKNTNAKAAQTGTWTLGPCNEYTFKHADGTCWAWEATSEMNGYWVMAPCTEANEVYKKSDGSCWNWFDKDYSDPNNSLGWIHVDCDMPKAWKNPRTGRCWKYTTEWSQVPCSTPKAVAHKGENTCWINNNENDDTSATTMEELWDNYWLSKLGREDAFPENYPWPQAAVDAP